MVNAADGETGEREFASTDLRHLPWFLLPGLIGSLTCSSHILPCLLLDSWQKEHVLILALSTGDGDRKKQSAAFSIVSNLRPSR